MLFNWSKNEEESQRKIKNKIDYILCVPLHVVTNIFISNDFHTSTVSIIMLTCTCSLDAFVQFKNLIQKTMCSMIISSILGLRSHS